MKLSLIVSILTCLSFEVYARKHISKKSQRLKIILEASEAENRKNSVKEAFLHTWSGYKKYAWGKDSLTPLTNSSSTVFGNWGATLVDGLTTLWLMDLKDEFKEAVDAVKKIDFTHSDGNINYFETTIRYLGGLISAYDLSGEQILLKQAIVLADQLLPAFETPSGYPATDFRLGNGPAPGSDIVALAAIGTCQLEFIRLTQITKDKKYEEKSMNVIDKLDKLEKPFTGLYPIFLNTQTGNFSTKSISFGAEGDSFYEYLIKVYMLTGKKDERLKRMYLESLKGFNSLVRTRKDGLKYFVRINESGQEENIVDHLSLFMGGLLQYGDFVLSANESSELGLKITETGYKFIDSTSTKLAPDSVYVNDMGPLVPNSKINILRPELLESLFYSWRFTKNSMYRNQAWEIFKAFNKYSKTPSGFAEYGNTESTDIKANQIDSMQSFWLAETLKYLYLVFSEDSVLDLNKFVFNTEAHPLKIPS